MTLKTASIILAITLYSLGAIAAFGFVWTRSVCAYVASKPEWREFDAVRCEERRMFGSLFGGLFWPFTLSIQFWEAVPAKKDAAP